MQPTLEHARLAEHRERKANWKQWGPYLSDRAWGTVREDYSPDGSAWEHFPHDQARRRAYRWGEDGIGGISDRFQYLCCATALWNGRDPILKERFFGLTGTEGNHGEDVKEYYFYMDATPTHSYMRMRYFYPQAEYPYSDLVAQNGRRGLHDFEYELLDTGVFANRRYFDVTMVYAKAGPQDILIKISATNCGDRSERLWLLPTFWFRNTWSWGYETGPMAEVATKPRFDLHESGNALPWVQADHPVLGRYHLYAQDAALWLFTENDTCPDDPADGPYAKDAFHRYLIAGDQTAVNPDKTGTKTTALYALDLAPGASQSRCLRLAASPLDDPFDRFQAIVDERHSEADRFYDSIQRTDISAEERLVQRQALAGMLWSKQFYYLNMEQWISGDPAMPPASEERRPARNRGWEHLNNYDIISMPDKWEYPWYAAWDLAFHCIPLALVDPDFAKRQIDLMAREWYMHPNGQMPAYEWAFGDVNPPVHAWAAYRVYKIDAKQRGVADRAFLEGIFHKLLLNFTWWVNRKDEEGKNVFQGGFLGLDNISVFDRSAPIPTGGHIDQSDGTAWMGFYCLVMLKIALELARENPVYQSSASKFFEHFLRIARAMTRAGHGGVSLWDEQDGFFYDVLHLPDGRYVPLKVRSLVGLMPLLAVETLEQDLLDEMPDFTRRMNWFFENRVYLRDRGHVACIRQEGDRARRLLSVVNRDHLERVLKIMLDPAEFLSDYGIRSLSRCHAERPYHFRTDSQVHTIGYQPAESQSGLFGGNSNWRGPVWFPINYLLIEALQKYDHFYGRDFILECPTGSGIRMTLGEIAAELSRRLIRLFLKDDTGKRPIYGGTDIVHDDPAWQDMILFHEYFHGDNGAGLGASHQTGWTGLVAKLIQQSGGHPTAGGGG